MAERLRTTAATVEAGNAATVTALEDLRAELAEVKASLQDFVQGRFSFSFTPGRSRMLPQGWDPLLSQGQGRPVSPPSPSLRGRPHVTPQPVSAPVAAVSLAPPPPVSLGGQLPPASPVMSAESCPPRTDSRGRCTPSQISGGSGRLVSPSASPPSMNSIAAGALAGAPRKSASTTPHAKSSSTKSGGALLATGRPRPWLGWKRSDWQLRHP